MSAPVGYWHQTWRDFARHRLALVALGLIVVVAYVALWCPLIANQRPLWIEAVLVKDHDEAVGIAAEAIDLLGATGSDAATLGRARTQLDRAADLLRESLAPAHHTELEAIVVAAGKLTTGDEGAALKLVERTEALYDAELRPVRRHPALRAMTRDEIAAALFGALLIPAAPLLWRWRRRGLLLVLIAAISFAAAWIMRRTWPPIVDNRPYRQIIESPEFAAHGGRVLRAIVPYGENENIIAEARQPPTWAIPVADRNPAHRWHWLGTDTNGRDVLARMVYGARVSMLIGLLAVALYTLIGVITGALAGYFGGWTDIVLSRVIEIVICFPGLLVILAIQAFLPPTLLNIILALALLMWTGVARLQRGEFLRLRQMDYIDAVRALGGGNLRIIFLHLLPNGIAPVLVMVSFGIAGSILVESGLSFLGFGVPQPTASWGDLLNNGRNDVRGLWWLTIFPGAVIFLTVTCFNLVGEAIRDALDPRRDEK
jgi:peptide/nickel transport system permease protein